MTLYLYKKGTDVPVLTIENAVSYTADQVMADGLVYSPLEAEYELSSLPDCSEELRAAWRFDHPDAVTRLEGLEDLMAELLFGGDAE